MLGVRANLSGTKELLAGMEDMKQAMKNKILRPAVNAMAGIFLKGAKAKCKSKLIRKSLGRKVKTYKNGPVGIVGPRKGFATVVNGEKVDPANIAHLLEGGRGPVAVKKASILAGHGQFWGQQVGPAAAQPFLRPAYDEGKGQAIQEATTKIQEGVAKQAAIMASKVK